MSRYRIYIDEVGIADMKSSANTNHRYLSLTGVIFENEYMRDVIHPEIERIKREILRAHPDEPLILHRKEILNKKYPFKILKDPKVEELFNNTILNCFREWEYTVISVLIDKKEHQTKYSVWRHDPYHYCMEILMERYYRFLEDIGAVGDVMVEARGGKEDRRLKKSYTRIHENGTNYIAADMFQIVFTSKQLKVKPKKANVSGLQIADLLAYPSRKYIFKYYDRIVDETQTFSDLIIEILKEKYYKRGNKVVGYGIKMLP